MELTNCTEEELWLHVAAHLKVRGFGVTLVGGAVVAIYTDGAYHSGDLDFVPEEVFDSGIESCMEEIGFSRSARHFEHPECRHLFVEFVSGPLGIGDDIDIRPDEQTVDGQRLKILSPTDCVRDRLASYIHFSVARTLDLGLAVR